MQLTGNTVLVTGGGTGIGRGLAKSLHQLGNQVVIAGRRGDVLQDVTDAHPGMQYLILDQSDATGIATFAGELTERFADLNVLVNNAGIQHVEDLTGGSASDAEDTVATNLLGPIRLTAALMPALLAQPRAAIINVTSALAFVPSALTPTYSATKAALHSLTESLRHQLRGTAIEVLEIIPPQVQTGLQGERGFDPQAMPLDEYVTEVMTLLNDRPDEDEIVVKRAETLRFAQRDGTYRTVYAAIQAASANQHEAVVQRRTSAVEKP